MVLLTPSEDVAVEARGLGKRYEIYDSPRARLKQLALSGAARCVNGVGRALGVPDIASAPRYYREFWALRNVSFQVRRGETFGVIGRNGGGKSTLLQILAGTLSQTIGEVFVNGRIAALLELGSGFNPEFTGRENVFLNGQILGLGRREIEDRFEEIAAFADIGAFMDQPVKTYSSGMFVRLAFAVQAHIDAAIVIIDEALAVGDVFFRQKCYSRLEKLRESGAAILLVSHSMPEVEQFCERALFLDRGEPRFIGPSTAAAKHYYLAHQAQGAPIGEVRELPDAPAIAGPRSDQTSGDGLETLASLTDLTGRPQVSNGQARCLGFHLGDLDGRACASFRQGEVAVFTYAFETLEDIEVPICGLLIANERGTIVHGKNAWQYPADVPRRAPAGSRIVCRQEISLQLGPGEYTFELALATLSGADWGRRACVPHDEFSTLYKTLCVAPHAGQLSVSLAVKNGCATLTHHGVADLPGKMSTRVIA